MTIFSNLQKIIHKGLSAVSGKAARVRKRVEKSVSPLADRILADALRLAEIPSPSPGEEARAAFVLERLQSLNINAKVDERGTIYFRLHSQTEDDGPPLLLFAYLGSKNWHSLESLSHVDDSVASGAGLADVLGAASLLSCAEGVSGGRVSPPRDIVFLFFAHSIDEPEEDVFIPFLEHKGEKPLAAFGLKGFPLGSVITQSFGSYRIRIEISREQEDQEPAAQGAGLNQVVDAVLNLARNLGSITWDSEHNTRCHIRRIETGTGFDSEPQEGVIELELISSDDALLTMSMKVVSATADSMKSENLRTAVNILSSMPVGDISVTNELISYVLELMKAGHIKAAQESGSDPSAFFTRQGIPALFLGVAQGRSGLNADRVRIDSLEKGRLLLEAVIQGDMKNIAKGG